MNEVKHTHAEAFCHMKYRCEKCGKWERIWNSRDGVTPYIVGSRCCNAYAQHVLWQEDVYAPNYKPAPGERFFRDGTAEDAIAITNRTFANYEEQGQPVPDEIKAVMLKDAEEQNSPSWSPGWPMLEEVPA